MAVNDEVLKRIKEEITNDPQNIGYAGKTDEEIKNILNNPVIKQRIVEDVYPSPMNRILSGIAGTPNIIDSKDLDDAKKKVL